MTTTTTTDVTVYVDMADGRKWQKTFPDADPTVIRKASNFLWKSAGVKRVHIGVKGN